MRINPDSMVVTRFLTTLKAPAIRSAAIIVLAGLWWATLVNANRTYARWSELSRIRSLGASDALSSSILGDDLYEAHDDIPATAPAAVAITVTDTCALCVDSVAQWMRYLNEAKFEAVPLVLLDASAAPATNSALSKLVMQSNGRVRVRHIKNVDRFVFTTGLSSIPTSVVLRTESDPSFVQIGFPDQTAVAALLAVVSNQLPQRSPLLNNNTSRLGVERMPATGQ